MTNHNMQQRDIDGKIHTIRELFSEGRRYSIDYYQREYKWETKQVSELINDLAAKFLESHEEGNEREAVDGYGHYFLGSIILSSKNGKKYIIDGQQRLTTLTLLLIFLMHLLDDRDRDQRSVVANLIFSYSKGKRSFKLDIPERAACMDAIYKGEKYSIAETKESVANILSRYSDIEELFPIELCDATLPFFVDWLLDNVHMVEITTYSDVDAYVIFETMNDRGLSLKPADMLKGYLLANITNNEKRTSASQVWKNHIRELNEIGKDEDADGIKSWLRSQYAQTIRERKRDAVPQDFDLIGTEFHRWVRDHEEQLDLKNSSDFANFIEKDFDFYSNWYKRIRNAAETRTRGLESIYFNAQHNFTLQYPLLLAPLSKEDSEEIAKHKIRVVADFIDILINRRIWSFRAISYSTMQYTMFLIMRDIRGKNIEELATLLRKRLDDENETFSTNSNFYLHERNGNQIHKLLARMTDFVETGSGQVSRYEEYSKRGRGGYEIEHIWANHFERHEHEFNHSSEFLDYRNRIGALLLLPKKFNASYGDLPYEKKVKYYLRHNLLAASLYEETYDRNPGFLRFINEKGLSFKHYTEFNKNELDQRQKLYIEIAECVWNPDRVGKMGNNDDE